MPSSIPYSFYSNPNNNNIHVFKLFLLFLCKTDKDSSLYSSTHALILQILSSWCVNDCYSNCIALFQSIDICIWDYHNYLHEDSSVFLYLASPTCPSQVWSDLLQYCNSNHPPFTFVKRVIQLFIHSYYPNHHGKDSQESIELQNLIVELLQDYQPDDYTNDYLDILLTVHLHLPMTLPVPMSLTHHS